MINIDDYQIENQIGKGSFGVVFKAIDKKTNKEVALKAIQPSTALRKKKVQKNILREMVVPLVLNLSGIVNLIGFRFPLTAEEKAQTKLVTVKAKDGTDIDLTGAIFVTELMKNGALDSAVREYLETKGAKHDKINKILFGVAATMKRAHRQNIIHRDLKLENVFLDDNLEPRIADFGIAREILNENGVTIPSGVPYIMHPEIFNVNVVTMPSGVPYIMCPEIFMDGDETYGISTDVLAYGFIIYKMFTSQFMFPDRKPVRSSLQFMMKICRGNRPIRPPDMPQPYWELCRQCWQQPDDRPTFEQITEILKDDKFAITEYGMTTDLDKLHEYQLRIDPDDEKIAELELSQSESGYILKMSSSFVDVTKPLKSTNRKNKFNWKRH